MRAVVLYSMQRSVSTLVTGEKQVFLRDPWYNGQRIADLALDLFKHCTMRYLTVGQALQDNKWLRHFKCNMPPAALRQFLEVNSAVATIQLQPGEHDSISWRWSSDGKYSANSAYANVV
jgi:hypothetical protein